LLSSLCQLFVSTFLFSVIPQKSFASRGDPPFFSAYRRPQTHESQSFSAELLEAKGTGNEQSSQNHHFKLSFVSNNKVYKKAIVDYYTHVC